jgi:hypothetical protein
MIRTRSVAGITTLKKALLASAAILAATAVLNSTSADAQQGTDTNQVLQQCVTFKNLGDQHASQAEAVQKIIAEEATKYSGAEAHRFVENRNKAAQSEWELAGLAQESYRKCLRDYVATPPTGPKGPVATQTPVLPVVSKPAVAAKPVRPAQPAQARRRTNEKEPQPEVVQGPGVSLIPFGLSILGAGRHNRESR